MAHSYLPLLFPLVFLTFISTLQLQSMAQTDGGSSEVATLLTIKKDWGNPPALSSWSSQNASSHCSWAGVTRCVNGQVTALSLQGLNLTNPVPSSICLLKNLTYLDLSFNNLTGEFPAAALSGCSAVRFLDLSYNHFSGALPSDIDKTLSSLSTMEHLNLSSNHFAGSVPPAIAAAFPNLKSLVLDTNSFNGTYPAPAIAGLGELETLTLAQNPFAPGPIPGELGKLTKLKLLWMSGMNLTGGVPDELSSLAELTTLALHENKLGGGIPAWVWKLPKLEVLYLYSNNFTGGIAPAITAVNLQEIDLSMNSLTGPIPASIGDLKNLSLLYLYFNKLNGTIPPAVARLPKLADVRLFSNRLSGPLPPELGKHSPLGNLEVSNNLLSGELPDTLCFNKKLYDIVVFNNSFSGEFPAILGDCVTVNNIMLYNNRFSGEFPEKVWSTFPALTTVMIQNNGFTGALPSVISSNITRIEMGNNEFSGELPASAPGLKTFLAENNGFSGALPANMSGLANLTELHLAGNRISGAIPHSIRSLGALNDLNLSRNQISGEIPAEIGSLPVLTILDLSDNELAGEVPEEFNNLHLSSLNLSSNQLAGELPESLQSAAFEDSFLGNRDLCAAAANHQNIKNMQACPDRRRNEMSTTTVLVVIVLPMLAASILAGGGGCLVVAARRRKQRGRDATSWRMTAFRKLDFTECDVLTALREDDVIGSGGSGKVYRVHLPKRGGGGGGGTVVAVKKLRSKGKAAEKLHREFDAEARILGEIRHGNIVSLLCCITSDAGDKLLVYEYMENGSLERWLHPKHAAGGGMAATAALDWATRLRIAVDAARGLSYMHEECARPVMHRDVKSSNILLDPAFRAKIADFGLARILVSAGGEPESVTAAGGTFGYMAPECGRGAKVNQKVDVYSFGVVLLELVTGRVANDGSKDAAECCLVEWAWRRYKAGGDLHDVVDGSIMDRAVHADDAVAVFVLGVMCTGDDAPSRPSMKQVLQQLARYDRTASVAGACRNGGDESMMGQLPAKGKQQGGHQAGKASYDVGAFLGGGDEESGNFVARPV